MKKDGGWVLNGTKIFISNAHEAEWGVVFARTETGFRAVPVTLGRQDGAMVTVADGLTGRERIAAANSFTLKSALGAAEAGHED